MSKQFNNVSELINDLIFSYDYVIFHQSSLLDVRLNLFFYYLSEAKKKYDKSPDICIGLDVFENIEKMATRASSNAIKVIKEYEQSGLLNVYNQTNGEIISLIASSNKKLLYITESLKSYKETVKKPFPNYVAGDKCGLLKVHDFLANMIIPVILQKAVLPQNNNTNPNYVEYKSGDQVYAEDGTPIVLQNLLQEGGEAQVFVISDQYVCKIFNQKEIDIKNKEEKTKHLVGMSHIFSNNNAFAWPISCVYDNHKKFIGYTMNFIKDTKIIDYVASGGSKERENILKDKRNLVKLCINVVNIFVKLHENYILVGDVSFSNFLFDSNYNVYLIDIDSVQVDQFFCPLVTQEFLIPEYIDDNLSYMKLSYREEQGELFLLATALFGLLVGDRPYDMYNESWASFKYGQYKYPKKYAHEGGDYSKLSYKGVYGSYAYNYDYLPSYLRDNFFDVFSGEGKAFKPGNRKTAVQWKSYLDIFYSYLNSLPEDSPELLAVPKSFFQNKEKTNNIVNSKRENSKTASQPKPAPKPASSFITEPKANVSEYYNGRLEPLPISPVEVIDSTIGKYNFNYKSLKGILESMPPSEPHAQYCKKVVDNDFDTLSPPKVTLRNIFCHANGFLKKLVNYLDNSCGPSKKLIIDAINEAQGLAKESASQKEIVRIYFDAGIKIARTILNVFYVNDAVNNSKNYNKYWYVSELIGFQLDIVLNHLQARVVNANNKEVVDKLKKELSINKQFNNSVNGLYQSVYLYFSSIVDDCRGY